MDIFALRTRPQDPQFKGITSGFGDTEIPLINGSVADRHPI